MHEITYSDQLRYALIELSTCSEAKKPSPWNSAGGSRKVKDRLVQAETALGIRKLKDEKKSAVAVSAHY